MNLNQTLIADQHWLLLWVGTSNCDPWSSDFISIRDFTSSLLHVCPRDISPPPPTCSVVISLLPVMLFYSTSHFWPATWFAVLSHLEQTCSVCVFTCCPCRTFCLFYFSSLTGENGWTGSIYFWYIKTWLPYEFMTSKFHFTIFHHSISLKTNFCSMY